MDTRCCCCSQLFTTPKVLPCSHVACRSCLLSVLAATQAACCPVCRHAIADLRDLRLTGGRTGGFWERVVDVLPTDLAMEALVHGTLALSGSRACTGCRSGGRPPASSTLCLTCGDNFCARCAEIHLNMTATRHHDVRVMSTMTPEQLAAGQLTVCNAHSGTPGAEYVCLPHGGVTVCDLCVRPSSRHRSCPPENRVRELRGELERLHRRVQSGEAGLGRAIGQLEQKFAGADAQGQQNVAGIAADFARMEVTLRACRARLERQALEDAGAVQDVAQGARDALVGRKDRLIPHGVFVDRAKRATPRQLLNGANPALRSRVNGLDLSAEIPGDVQAAFNPPMTVDRNALRELEREIDSLVLQPLLVRVSEQ